MNSNPDRMLKKHPELVHSENVKVTSHVQREDGEWLINTLMIEGCEVPFKYKRTKRYKDLKGQRVNLTYYPATEQVAGFDVETFKVTRVRVA